MLNLCSTGSPPTIMRSCLQWSVEIWPPKWEHLKPTKGTFEKQPSTRADEVTYPWNACHTFCEGFVPSKWWFFSELVYFCVLMVPTINSVEQKRFFLHIPQTNTQWLCAIMASKRSQSLEGMTVNDSHTPWNTDNIRWTMKMEKFKKGVYIQAFFVFT